jgi:aminopeptidase
LGRFIPQVYTSYAQLRNSYILFDEKIGGTCHLALGRGFPDSLSKNESSIHWDMICDLRQGGEIWVDDVLIHKDGAFTFDPQ